MIFKKSCFLVKLQDMVECYSKRTKYPDKKIVFPLEIKIGAQRVHVSTADTINNLLH